MYEQPICKSIFKDGKSAPTRQEFTQFWVTLINQLERAKANCAQSR